MRAGFNNETFPQLRKMMLVSEPEAAAIYTARYLKEARVAEFQLRVRVNTLSSQSSTDGV